MYEGFPDHPLCRVMCRKKFRLINSSTKGDARSKTPVTRTRAYFETSALDAIVKQEIPTSYIRRQLKARRLTACVGALTLNESAQAILSDKGDLARVTFKLIRDLKPRFLAETVDLYEQETRLVRGGTAVIPYPSEAQENFVRDEVDKLADGRINVRFVELLLDRQRVKFKEWPASMEKYLAELKKLRRNFPGNVRRFRTFEQVEAFFRPDLARFVAGLDGLSLSIDEAEAIAAAIDRYPAIRTSVYFCWNALFICLVDGRVPSVDKVDDYRHVIEASYCDVFVSNDNQLLRSIPRLHPTLAALRIDDLVPSIPC